MAQTTFSGPVTSNAGFNSDDTLTSADYTNGGFNLTNFTVRPAATYANTVAALVGAVNQRTAGVSGGNIFGVYAQTSFSDNPTSTLTGLNTAVYGVVDCGSSTSIGTAYGATFDMAQFAGTRASRPKAFIAFGEESSATNPTEFLFDIGRPSKSVAQVHLTNIWNTNYFSWSNKSFSKRRNSLHSIVFDFYLIWTKKQLRSVLQL
jgi:hypothetical protein